MNWCPTCKKQSYNILYIPPLVVGYPSLPLPSPSFLCPALPPAFKGGLSTPAPACLFLRRLLLLFLRIILVMAILIVELSPLTIQSLFSGGKTFVIALNQIPATSRYLHLVK